MCVWANEQGPLLWPRRLPTSHLPGVGSHHTWGVNCLLRQNQLKCLAKWGLEGETHCAEKTSEPGAAPSGHGLTHAITLFVIVGKSFPFSGPQFPC